MANTIQPELSIIVPVYNMAGDDKLRHCMDSLLAQTISNYEIIAVDDCSTDTSYGILKEYEKCYPDKVKVLQNACNMRQGGAKNAGLKLATGKYVGFIDSDDWISADMYEKLLNKAYESGADLVGCDYTIVDRYTFDKGQNVVNNTSEQTGVMDDDVHKLHILRCGSMVVKIYLRSVISDNNLNFPEHIFYEDNCAGPLWSVYFTHFERVDEALYYYLTLPASTTHHVDWDKCMDRITAGRQFLEECRERGIYERYKDEIEYRFMELSYAGTLFSYMYSGRKRRLRNTAILRKMIISKVPDFRDNPYYEKYMKAEDKSLINLHMRSNLLFFVYYIMLFTYRKTVNKIRKNKK